MATAEEINFAGWRILCAHGGPVRLDPAGGKSQREANVGNTDGGANHHKEKFIKSRRCQACIWRLGVFSLWG